MPASKAQRAVTAERRRQALALRLAGADYETIARQLEYASRGAACTDIQRALEASLAEQARNAEVLRHEQLLALNRLRQAHWAAALQDPKVGEFVLRLIDRVIRLNRLDLPVRIEVLTMSAIEAEIERLSAELAGVGQGQEAPSEPDYTDAVGSAETGPAT